MDNYRDKINSMIKKADELERKSNEAKTLSAIYKANDKYHNTANELARSITKESGGRITYAEASKMAHHHRPEISKRINKR